MVVSATISTAPTLVYFGQELGEPGAENAGYGKPSRTSIFDYIGVPTFQRWVNNKKFDGGQSTQEEKNLRDFYKRLLNFTINSSALASNYQDLHTFNRANTENYTDKVLSFARWSDGEKLVIVSNFEAENSHEFELKIPEELIKSWNLEDGSYSLSDQLYGNYSSELKVENQQGIISIKMDPLESFILKIN
jgi:glycosidase